MLKVFQANCEKKPEAMVAALESGLQLGADVVFIQEPPSFQHYSHVGYTLAYRNRTATAFRINTQWKWTAREDLDAMAEGYAQVWDLKFRNRPQLRIVNVYDQERFNDAARPAREINWARIITTRTIICGDFNAHSSR